MPADVLARLPEAAPEQLVFRSKHRACGSPAGVTLLWALRHAMITAGISDWKRLDVHSFRRAWITSAHRAGVPMALSMRQVGHVTPAMHLHYQRRAVPDDLGPAVEKVAELRRNRPPATPSPSTRSGPQVSARPRSQTCLPEAPSQAATDAAPVPSADGPPADPSTPGDVRARLCAVLRWTGDPHSSAFARWIAEDPVAAWALLNDPLRQLAARQALLEVAPEVVSSLRLLAQA